jgi:hypothetical protein
MIAELGVNMMITAEVKHEQHLSGGKRSRTSGIALGEKVNHSVNIRGVADIAEFHLKIEHLNNIVHFHGKGRAVRKMIDQGFNFAEIYWSGKYFFHQ